MFVVLLHVLIQLIAATLWQIGHLTGLSQLKWLFLDTCYYNLKFGAGIASIISSYLDILTACFRDAYEIFTESLSDIKWQSSPTLANF